MGIDPESLLQHARLDLIQDECSLSYFLFADDLSELRLLRTTVEQLIVREESSEVTRLDAVATKLPDDRRGDFWAEHHPYWWDHIIAPQFRGAFFIALMSAAELHLKRLARDAGTVADAQIDVDGLKGNPYRSVRGFLKDYCDINKPSEARWQRLLGYYEVRNILVHNGGIVPDGRRRRTIENLARQVRGLTIGPATLELDSAFCEAAHREVEDFLLDVWGELVLLCRRHK